MKAFGERGLVQRCQEHKRRNDLRLPKKLHSMASKSARGARKMRSSPQHQLTTGALVMSIGAMASHVNHETFAEVMPPSLRTLLADAARGDGPLAAWMTQARGRATRDLIADETVPLEARGWLLGISTFDDRCDFALRWLAQGHAHECAPFALRAFAAGISLGVPPLAGQWKHIERMAQSVKEPPDGLVEALAKGCGARRAGDRGAALRLVAHYDAREAIAAALPNARGKAKQELEAALAALGGASPPEPDGLLLRMLALWRRTEDPRLGKAIVGRGARMALERGPLPQSRSKSEREGAWFVIVKRGDPTDLDRLLDTEWPHTRRSGEERVHALYPFAPDPRLMERLPGIVEPYMNNPSHRFLGFLKHRIRGPAATSRPEKHEEEIQSLLREADEAQPEEVATIDTLWDALHAEPGDPERRLVLADALQRVGDPRGELIAFGMALAGAHGDQRKALTKRIDALVDQHGDAWLAPFVGVERNACRFERGFPTIVRVKTTAEHLEAAASDPAWRYVEELHIEGNFPRGFERAIDRVLQNAPQLRSLILHEWRGGLESLQALEGVYPKVRCVAVRDIPDRPLDAFPSLTHFGTGARAWHATPDGEERIAQLGLSMLIFCNEETIKRQTGTEALEEMLQWFSASSLPALRLFRDFPRVTRKAHGPVDMPTHHREWLLELHRDGPAYLAWGEGRYKEGTLTRELAVVAAHGWYDFRVVLPRIGRAGAEKECQAFKAGDVRIADIPLRLWSLDPSW